MMRNQVMAAIIRKKMAKSKNDEQINDYFYRAKDRPVHDFQEGYVLVLLSVECDD